MRTTRHLDDEYVQPRTLVVFKGPQFDIAFDALRVRELRACEDWIGGQPVVLSRALGSPASADTSSQRVVVVETDDEQEVPVLAEGAISIQTVPGDSFVPPPPDSDYLSGVVPGEHDTVLVEPDLLRNLVA